MKKPKQMKAHSLIQDLWKASSSLSYPERLEMAEQLEAIAFQFRHQKADAASLPPAHQDPTAFQSVRRN